MHGGLGFVVNNNPTPRAEPEDKGGYVLINVCQTITVLVTTLAEETQAEETLNTVHVCVHRYVPWLPCNIS